MYGLPQSTECKKQVPKRLLYQKFDLKTSQRSDFDAGVSRMDIVATLSPTTLPAISSGKKIKCIYVLAVQLKGKDYDSKNILLLSRLIPQNILFALQFGSEVQFVIFYANQLIRSDWIPTENAIVTLSGLNLDTVWENIVKGVGVIEIEQGNSLEDQIQTNEKRAKILSQISILEHKMAKEKQPRRKREYFFLIKKLKSDLQ